MDNMFEPKTIGGTLFKSFEVWQRLFPCPNCGKTRLDFIITKNIKAPIICTWCDTLFTLKAKVTEDT